MGLFSGLRRRYGRSASPQAITRPSSRGHDLVDVIEVDSKGTNLRSLARGVKLSLAHLIIKKHKG